MSFLSVCIPTYEMKNIGPIFLEHSFNILAKQSFKDFEVVISDHSSNDGIKEICNKYKDLINVKYHKNIRSTLDLKKNSEKTLNKKFIFDKK